MLDLILIELPLGMDMHVDIAVRVKCEPELAMKKIYLHFPVVFHVFSI